MKFITRFTSQSYLLALGLFMSLGSCDSFVEVDLPTSQLTSSAVFEEPATAHAAMTDIYARLRDGGMLSGIGSGTSASLGVYTDELTFYGASVVPASFFYTNSVLPNNATVSSWWSNGYAQIYAANAVYEGVSASTKLSPEVKQQLQGEALFVRGLLHFYLVNLYGAIPYVTSTDYTVNSVVTRQSVAEVYDLVIADLEMAQSLLPEAYVDPARIRPNKAVATALLARVYLYHGDYAEASNAASAVLNDTGTYGFPTNINNTFLKDSSSTLWQLIPATNGRNTSEGTTLIFNAGPPPFAALRAELLGAFETGDLRRQFWVRAVTTNGNTWYHSFKYKQRGSTATTQEYSIVMRLSEQYLIRAEARARQGELIGAQDDLNVIRNIAGLGDTTAMTQQALLEAILAERRVELFCEFGYRFFDLKRYQGLDTALSGVKPGWNTTDALLPIPESELLLNPNLAPQNPGY